MPSLPRLSRNAAIVLGVIGFHGVALIALQTGLLRRAVELVVPVEMVAVMVEPPKPVVAPPPPAPPKPQPQVAKPVAKPPPPRPQPAPTPVPVQSNDPPPPTAPIVVAAPPAPPPPVAAPVQVAPAPPAAPPPAPPAPPAPRIELPSTDAAYLRNPPPAYPAVSRRLNEQGTVMVRVLITVEGTPRRVELQKSSGFERLDESAMATIAQWKFVPGKRNGVPEEMWYTVPVAFSLSRK